jgi:hypothetical protein
LLAFAGSLAGCADTRRALGEACLKNGDCLSGVCSEQRCAAEPPVLDAEPPVQDATPDVTDTSPTEGGG